MSNSELLLAYGKVIVDIEEDDTWNENDKQIFLHVLKDRIWELTEVLGDNNE